MTRRIGRVCAIGVLVVAVGSCASRVSYRELAQEYYNLGNAFFELGDYERSFSYYTRAVELDDELPASGYNLARLYAQREEYESALELLRDLLRDDPENGLYRETEAYLLYHTGDPVAARAAYRTLIGRYPARSRIRYNLALLELQEERAAVARRVLEFGLPYAQEDSEYYWLLADACYRSDDIEAAADYLETYRSIVLEEPELMARLAKRYADWDFQLAALEVLAEIPETVDGDAELQFLEAQLYLTATPDFDTGIAALRAALTAGFDETEALRDLLFAVRSGDRDAVQAVYDEYNLDLDTETEEGEASETSDDDSVESAAPEGAATESSVTAPGGTTAEEAP